MDLAAVTAELASVFRSAVDRAGLEFVVDCPALDEPVYVDRDMWEKVVLNLLSNALKFTFDGSISVRVRREGGDAVVTVADTGIGVAADEMPRLFERFHRIESAHARSNEGSGIGLALVQELVNLHGGRIDADSAEGVGTTFTIRLPFGAAPSSGRRGRLRQAALGRPPAWPNPTCRRRLRWIPGDDDVTPAEVAESALTPDNAKLHVLAATRLRASSSPTTTPTCASTLARLLSGAGYQVEAVTDGQQALDRVRGQTCPTWSSAT